MKRLAVTVVVLAICAGIFYGAQIWRISRPVPLPPASASPADVVEAFLAAINGHDCDTAAALWVVQRTHDGRQWCEDLTSVSAKFYPAVPDAASKNEFDVSVEETVKVRPFHETGMSGNVFGWTYHLVKTPMGWRIADDGQG